MAVPPVCLRQPDGREGRSERAFYGQARTPPPSCTVFSCLAAVAASGRQQGVVNAFSVKLAICSGRMQRRASFLDPRVRCHLRITSFPAVKCAGGSFSV